MFWKKKSVTDTTPPSVPANVVASNVTESTADVGWDASVDSGGSGVDYYVVTYAPAGTDTTPPSVPANVVASNVTESSADVTWDASTDDVGVDHYVVTYVPSGSVPDTTPPSAPTLSAVSHTDKTVTLSVGSVADADHYTIYQGSTVSASNVQAGNTTITGLSPSTTYDFTATATDAAGNESAVSNTVSVTTNAAAGGYTATDAWVHFDGVDGYGKSPAMGIGGSAFSVATVIRFDNTADYQKIMSVATGRAGSSAIWVISWNPSGQLVLNESAATSATQSLVGSWFRLVATSTTSGGELAVYDMSGSLVASVTEYSGRSAPGNIGYWMMEGAYSYQQGDVARCVLFGDELSSSERSAFGADGSLPTDNVVADYPVAAGSGTTLADASSNGNDLSLHGGTTWESG